MEAQIESWKTLRTFLMFFNNFCIDTKQNIVPEQIIDNREKMKIYRLLYIIRFIPKKRLLPKHENFSNNSP